jgi:hypothetical protein
MLEAPAEAPLRGLPEPQPPAVCPRPRPAGAVCLPPLPPPTPASQLPALRPAAAGARPSLCWRRAALPPRQHRGAGAGRLGGSLLALAALRCPPAPHLPALGGWRQQGTHLGPGQTRQLSWAAGCERRRGALWALRPRRRRRKPPLLRPPCWTPPRAPACAGRWAHASARYAWRAAATPLPARHATLAPAAAAAASPAHSPPAARLGAGAPGRHRSPPSPQSRFESAWRPWQQEHPPLAAAVPGASGRRRRSAHPAGAGRRPRQHRQTPRLEARQPRWGACDRCWPPGCRHALSSAPVPAALPASAGGLVAPALPPLAASPVDAPAAAARPPRCVAPAALGRPAAVSPCAELAGAVLAGPVPQAIASPPAAVRALGARALRWGPSAFVTASSCPAPAQGHQHPAAQLAPWGHRPGWLRPSRRCWRPRPRPRWQVAALGQPIAPPASRAKPAGPVDALSGLARFAAPPSPRPRRRSRSGRPRRRHLRQQAGWSRAATTQRRRSGEALRRS